MFSLLPKVLILLSLTEISLAGRHNNGPTIDQGVFVITHINTCRNGAGYCILGYSCDVDKDFIADDLGGNCDGLGAAFNPVTTFVCCRENPDTRVEIVDDPEIFDESDGKVVEAQSSSSTTEAPATTTPEQTTTTSTTTAPPETVTEIVRESVTETETSIEVVTKIESVTEISSETSVEPESTIGPQARIDIGDEVDIPIRPGLIPTNLNSPISFDSKNPEDNCFAAILLGFKCGGSDPSPRIDLEDEKISTAQTGLEPDREDVSATPMTVSVDDVIGMQHPATNKATVQIRNGDVLVNGDFAEEDIVPLKFKPTNPTEVPAKLSRKDDENEQEERFRTDQLISSITDQLANLKRDESVEDSLTEELENPTAAKLVNPTEDQLEPVNLDVENFDEEDTKNPSFRLESTADKDDQASFFQSNCGQLGGSAVLQAFGRAAHNLLPDLVASWVTGHVGTANRGLRKSSRLDDDDPLEPRIIGGAVTSTVLYCWMAAIVEYLPGDKKKFLCTGTLVKQDLIITSASCTHRLFERGIQHFKVVLGDSNLNIDLPFGVQSHEISDVIIHENYKPEDAFHFDDIGMIKLKTLAKLENTVCTLCLPPEEQKQPDMTSQNCTVVGYGRPNDATATNVAELDDDATDGILRKAELPIVDSNVCLDYLASNNAGFDQDHLNDGFLCAGGTGNEESCFVAMDGGSPLSCQHDGRHELTGLVTYATACPHDKSPSLFTNVSKFTSWIRKNYLKMKR